MMNLTSEEFHILKDIIIDEIKHYCWWDYSPYSTMEHVEEQIKYIVDNIFKTFWETKNGKDK